MCRRRKELHLLKKKRVDTIEDHLSGMHNLRGDAYKPLRHRLLEVAHSEYEPDEATEKMISSLPRKFETFTDDTIDITYLEADMDDILQSSIEMMLPIPKWAQDKQLEILLHEQTETKVEDIWSPPWSLDRYLKAKHVGMGGNNFSLGVKHVFWGLNTCLWGLNTCLWRRISGGYRVSLWGL